VWDYQQAIDSAEKIRLEHLHRPFRSRNQNGARAALLEERDVMLRDEIHPLVLARLPPGNDQHARPCACPGLVLASPERIY